MKNIFRDIILERQLEALGPYTPRDKKYRLLPNKALAVIGIRRCGKTTFLKQIWDELKKTNKVGPKQLVYVNFFDERLFGIKASQLGAIVEAYDELNSALDSNTDIHFFLDEIQVVKGWEMFVDRLLRARNRHVYISGSSATLLSKEVSSAMRGRSLSLELFPFSFFEALRAENIETRNLAPRQRAQVTARFREYLLQGGFPETLSVDPLTRRRILQEYLNVVLLKDIIERHNPTDPASVSYMLKLLMNQIGSLYTGNKTCERLRAAGLKVTKTEVAHFLDWFLDSYLLFTVPIFSNSIARQTVNPRKFYCIDPGMAYAVSKSVSENIGHLLENVVFLKIRRETEQIFYYRDNRQREVDFVYRNEQGRLKLIQVCLSLKDESVRTRELEALEHALVELGEKSGTIVTMDEREEIRFQGLKINVIPAWEYLLDKEK